MAKKKKTLPKNFEELLTTGDIVALKSVFDQCEIDAKGGYGKQTALAYDNCPHELAKWLVENGADLEATDTWGNTPLHKRSRSIHGNIKSLLALKPNINSTTNSIGTPLHAAADSHNTDNVSILIEHGADLEIQNRQGLTPLQQALRTCRNTDIPATRDIIKLFINKGQKPNEKSIELLQEIGENFEFHRDNFNKELLPKVEEALRDLYDIFQVNPIQSRKMHDGSSDIIPTSLGWQNQHTELWELLVPSSGHCQTIQGEVIRISGRISNELEGNGGINWDSDFKIMAETFYDFTTLGTPLPDSDLFELRSLIKEIKEKNGDSYRMAELAVKWVSLNPKPINLNNTIEYKR